MIKQVEDHIKSNATIESWQDRIRSCLKIDTNNIYGTFSFTDYKNKHILQFTLQLIPLEIKNCYHQPDF
jgi:hypothetical protein